MSSENAASSKAQATFYRQWELRPGCHCLFMRRHVCGSAGFDRDISVEKTLHEDLFKALQTL